MRNAYRHVGFDTATVERKNAIDPALHGVVRSTLEAIDRAGRWSEMSGLANLVFLLWYFEVIPFITNVGEMFVVARPPQQ